MADSVFGLNMRDEALEHFVCPSCGCRLLAADAERDDGRLKAGYLVCEASRHRFEVRDFVPRFVASDEVTAAFGFEWNKYPRIQFDSVNGMRLSEDRFFRQTNWSRNLIGQRILEIGSGAGRFTEIALKTGAQVFSIDASRAVDANIRNHGADPNFVLCQASLFALPFPEAHFDKVFCFGVLQHTPDVAKAFAAIARFVKPGGELAVDVYNKDYWRNYHRPLYLVRPLTRRIPHESLHRWLSRWVPRLLPVSTWLRNEIPLIGRQLAGLLPIANYNGIFPTHDRSLLEQYAILDTFDTLSPRYISPQRPSTVREWFNDAGYENVVGDDGTVFWMRGRRTCPIAGSNTRARQGEKEGRLAV